MSCMSLQAGFIIVNLMHFRVTVESFVLPQKFFRDCPRRAHDALSQCRRVQSSFYCCAYGKILKRARTRPLTIDEAKKVEAPLGIDLDKT